MMCLCIGLLIHMILKWFIHAFILILFSLFLNDSFLFIKRVCEVLLDIECFFLIIIHHFQPVSHHHAEGKHHADWISLFFGFASGTAQLKTKVNLLHAYLFIIYIFL